MKSILKSVLFLLFTGVAFAAPVKNNTTPLPLPENTKVIEVGSTAEIKEIEKALDKVEEIRRSDRETPIAIKIAPGDYFPDHPLEITSRHSTTNMGPLFVIASDFNKRPRIHGGLAITNWIKVAFNKRKDVYCADLSEAYFPGKIKIVSLDGQKMHPARYPNLDPKRPLTSYHVTKKAAANENNRHSDEIWMKEEDMRSWAHPEDGWATVACPINFGNKTIDIVGVSKNIINLKGAHNLKEGWRGRWDRWYVENIAEELDEPGEWYFDPREKKLYIIPFVGKDPTKSVIGIGTLDAVLKIKGSSNCTVAGLDLMDGYMDGIKMLNTDFINIHACTIHNMNKSAMFVEGCNLNITDCDIYETCNGIFITNGRGNFGKIDGRMNLVVENNYIHHCTGTGIWLWGQGVTIKNNLIHDLPRSAIAGFGRFCEISYNRIRHVHLLTDDGGAIYDNRWSNGVGTHICYNWISDTVGYKSWGHGTYDFNCGAVGIYLDECSGGLTIYGNLVERSHIAGLHLHNGRWTTVSNNIFVSNGTLPANHYTYQVSLQTWDKKGFKGACFDNYAGEYRGVLRGDPRWKQFPSMAQDPNTDEVFAENGTMMMGIKVVNNIFYYPDQGAGKLFLAHNLDMKTNFFDSNLYWPGKTKGKKEVWIDARLQGKKGDSSWDIWRRYGQDKKSVIAEPNFINPKGGDYKLRSNSPALKLGFKQLPFEKMGLKKSKFRATLPKEAEGVREHPEWLTKWTSIKGAGGAVDAKKKSAGSLRDSKLSNKVKKSSK